MKNKKPTLNNSLRETVLYLTGLLLLLWVVNHRKTALLLLEQPRLIWPYLIEQLGWSGLIAATIGTIIMLWLLMILSGDDNANILRGAKLVSSHQLRKKLKRQPQPKQHPQIQLAGMPISATYKNRGFFLVGSPGSGKTQAISQMVSLLRQRSDFRGIIFDRGGELLEKFYQPKQDLIFNPLDRRSCHWSHTDEPARVETMAAGLIPIGSTKEPFFPTAGRAVMAELFRQTHSNAELWTLLQSDTNTLSSFLDGTLASRYLAEEKVATSILSTVANSCQFYSSLIQPQKQKLSFYCWGASDSRRWIFVTVRENDEQLLKPLYSLAFELMLKGLLSNPQRRRKTAIVIDELGALNQLPSLHRLLSESRKYLGCPILGTQTEAQITKIYGQEDTRIILQGTKTKLLLNCADPQTAETMAQIIGKQESLYFTSNRSRNIHQGGQNQTVSENEQIRENYAVLPAQLQDLPDLRGYLKMAGLPAAAVRVKVKHFLPCAKRFIAASSTTYTGQKNETIEQQWQKIQTLLD